MQRYPKSFQRALRSIYKTIRYELKALICSIVGSIKVALYKKAFYGAKLEIGAGPCKKDDFITNDLSLRADVPFDLRMGLPFPENSLRFIYCEAVLEHFEFEDLLVLLDDCYKALMEGGIFSCSVPDASLYVDAYLNNNLSIMDSFKTSTGYFYKHKMDILNHVFYMAGHHKYMFDKTSLLTLLESRGFKDVHIRDFDEGLDQASRKHESLYIECIK